MRSNNVKRAMRDGGRWAVAALLGCGLFGLVPSFALAAGEASVQTLETGLNALWVMLSAILVLFMQAGFILLESGSTRMKNAGHVAGKTVFTVGLCSLVYWAAGYGLIFGSEGNAFVGWGDFFFNPQAAAGMLVFYSAKLFEKLRIDDPIYALSVHGMAGI